MSGLIAIGTDLSAILLYTASEIYMGALIPLKIVSYGPVSSIDILDNCKIILAGYANGSIIMWDIASRVNIAETFLVSEAQNSISSINSLFNRKFIALDTSGKSKLHEYRKISDSSTGFLNSKQIIEEDKSILQISPLLIIPNSEFISISYPSKLEIREFRYSSFKLCYEKHWDAINICHGAVDASQLAWHAPNNAEEFVFLCFSFNCTIIMMHIKNITHCQSRLFQIVKQRNISANIIALHWINKDVNTI